MRWQGVVRDVLATVGLAAVGWGAWRIDPSIAAIAVGLLLFLLALQTEPPA